MPGAESYLVVPHWEKLATTLVESIAAQPCKWGKLLHIHAWLGELLVSHLDHDV
jgi:hypothetical protein